MNPGEGGLERLKAYLLALSASLPDLIERAQAGADAGGGIPALSVIDPQLEGQRLAAFAAYLEHHSRIDGRILGPIDVRAILEQAIALTRAEIESRARVIASYLPAPLVRANPAQLGQVFVSLLVNAAQAIAPGAPQTHRVGVELDTDERGWARVAIADTGSGIAAEHLPRIFEPLFSTKRGAGMGIGLAVVREIVQGLGGHISVESQPGFGTLFILELPPAP